MANKLFVSSRKGLIEFHRQGAQWTYFKLHFPADPVTAFLAHDGIYLAAINAGHFGVKLFRSTDTGGTWSEVPTPAYPPQPEPDAKPPWKLVQTWIMEAAPDGTLWMGTIPGGLFSSHDQGLTWKFNEALWNLPVRGEWAGGGYDYAGIHSICFLPSQPGHMLIGISTGGVLHSPDSGATWRQDATGMVACYMPPELQLQASAQDPHRIVQCPAHPQRLWCQHHCGVFYSHDFGYHWQAPAASPFGFAAAVHPQNPDVAWFVPAQKDERRIPVQESLHALRTRDGGSTFEELRNGLPQAQSFDLIYRHSLVVDESGDTLFFGSTTGNLYQTPDGGESWSTLSNHLPPIYALTLTN
jgi:photosystem II stability/assembly factor-like uncharacterized protein